MCWEAEMLCKQRLRNIHLSIVSVLSYQYKKKDDTIEKGEEFRIYTVANHPDPLIYRKK